MATPVYGPFKKNTDKKARLNQDKISTEAVLYLQVDALCELLGSLRSFQFVPRGRHLVLELLLRQVSKGCFLLLGLLLLLDRFDLLFHRHQLGLRKSRNGRPCVEIKGIFFPALDAC